MRCSVGEGGDGLSCAGTVCSRRVDVPMKGLLWSGRTATTKVVVGKGVRHLWLTFVLGAPWAKASAMMRPLGTAFPVGGIVFPSSIVFQW